MSNEESDEDDRQTWRVSQPAWRPQGLTNILHHCQKKIMEHSSTRMVHQQVASGTASKTGPHKGVKAEYLKGSVKLFLNLYWTPLSNFSGMFPFEFAVCCGARHKLLESVVNKY